MLQKLYASSERLNPNWITGFTDSEGSFILNVESNKSKKGVSFRPIFAITVHSSDKYILYKIKKFFNNIGSVRKIRSYYCYKVESTKEMKEVIIPHFEQYPLLSKNKFKSFFLLKSCVEILSQNKILSETTILELLKYKASFKKGLNAKIFKKYKNIIEYDINKIINTTRNIEDINPFWLAGFVAGDGSFGVYGRGKPSFRISQDKIDELLLINISSFFNSGKITKSKTGMRDLNIRSILDLNNIIIPFFKKYKLCTSKEIDFYYFCEIMKIINKKGYNKKWMEKDLEKVKLLTLKMNNHRRKT